MTTAGIETVEQALQQTDFWLKDLARRLGSDDRHAGYLAVRAALHGLRDRLAVDKAARSRTSSSILPRPIRALWPD